MKKEAFNAPFAKLPSVHDSLTKVQYLNYKFSSSQIPFFRFLCQITCTVKCRCKVVEIYHQMDLRFRVHFLHKMLNFLGSSGRRKRNINPRELYITPHLVYNVLKGEMINALSRFSKIICQGQVNTVQPHLFVRGARQAQGVRGFRQAPVHRADSLTPT